MKRPRELSIALLTAIAVMASPSLASATTATSNGSLYTGPIEAASEGALTFHGPFTITCNGSVLKAGIESHGDSATASGFITTLTFTECNQHFTVVKKGQLTIHTDTASADGNGTVTWAGGEITVQITSLGISCLLGTSSEGVDLGVLTGSKNTGSTATLDLNNATIPRTGHSVFCGSSWELTGSYTFSTPDNLDID